MSAGAAGVVVGTSYLACEEADVHPVYRDRLFRAKAADTRLTTVFDVGWPQAPHLVLRNPTFDVWWSAGSPPSGRRPGEDQPVRDGTAERSSATATPSPPRTPTVTSPQWRRTREGASITAGQNQPPRSRRDCSLQRHPLPSESWTVALRHALVRARRRAGVSRARGSSSRTTRCRTT